MNWWIAAAQEALGQAAEARKSWSEAAQGRANDGQRYFRGLALQKLGENEKAQAVFKELAALGEERIGQGKAIDFFASFGEQQSQRSRQADAYYLAGLGHLGLGEVDEARQAFAKALESRPDHLGAATAQARMSRPGGGS